MRHLPSTLFLFLATATHAGSQIIEIPSLPVSREYLQFDIPSTTRAMGHISIAMRDELADPFVNPADIMREKGTMIFLSPGASTWSLTYDALSRVDNWTMKSTAEQHRASILSASAGILYRNGNTGVAAAAGSRFNNGHSKENTFYSTSSRHYSNQNNSISYYGKRFPVMISFAGKMPENGIALGGSFGWTPIEGSDEIRLRHRYDGEMIPTGNQYEVRLGATSRIGTGDAGLIVGYSSLGIEQRSSSQGVKHSNATWFAQMKYRIPVSDQFDLGAQATANRIDHRSDLIYGNPRTTITANAFDAGIGTTWKSPWGPLALEYLIEPVSSIYMRERVDFSVDPEGNLLESTTQRISQLDMKFLHHTIRVGTEFGIMQQTKMRLGSQIRLGTLAHSCSSHVLHTQTENVYQSPWTLACTGGVEVGLSGSCRLTADAEILMRHNVSGPETAAFSWTQSSTPACEIPIDRLMDAPVLAGRLALVWNLNAE